MPQRPDANSCTFPEDSLFCPCRTDYTGAPRGDLKTVVTMNTDVADAEAAEQVVARFLCGYHKIWQRHFPGLNKRAHWHVMFSARCSPQEGVSCRSIHRTLYGLYGTSERSRSPGIDCDRAVISAIFGFFNSYDQKWRETCELVVRQKGLTPAYANDAMDHLVTYQYWAIVMLLWSASPFGGGRPDAPAIVIDEINSRMWDALRLGHLAIKERVGNLIRWGFFAEQTIKKHKAVALTPIAGSAISRSLAETKPLLQDLYAKLVPQEAAA